MSEGYEIKKQGGLVALEYAEHEWENPLTWWNIKERGECGMASVEGVKSGDPGEVDCPRCEGSGELTAKGEEPECPDCEGYGVRAAKTMTEWCEDHGAVAAVPVSYNMGTSQPWIHTVEWENLEDACSILYLEGEEEDHTVEALEGRIADLSVALEVGYSVVTVEVDPDGALPLGALRGWDGGGVGMILGRSSVEDEATRQMESALEYLEKEGAEREEWARRGVVTV